MSHANKKFKFRDLPSFQLLVAGEVSCLLVKNMPHVEREARLKLLAETAYLSEKVPWDTADDINFNVMCGVERGDSEWGDSIFEIQTSLMIGCTVPSGTHSKGASLKGQGPNIQLITDRIRVADGGVLITKRMHNSLLMKHQSGVITRDPHYNSLCCLQYTMLSKSVLCCLL